MEAAPTPTTATRTSRVRCAPTTARTSRGCGRSRARWTRRTGSAPPRASGDGDRRADFDQLVQLQDVGVLHPHAAVRDATGDQPWLVGAVDADDAAAGPVGQRVRRRAGDEGQRPVGRVLVARELRAHIELALRRRPLLLADPDIGAEDALAVLDDGRLVGLG